jgi:integrase
VKEKPPHCARHTVGLRVVEATGNVAAVSVALGHKNQKYSMSYIRPRHEDILAALEAK